MFQAPPRVAWTAAALAALVAGAAAAHAVAPLGPLLTWHLLPLATKPEWQMVSLHVEPRGGETIAVVEIEVVRGEVKVLGAERYLDLPPGSAANFLLNFNRDQTEDPLVRIHQRGWVERAYDVTLPVDRRR